MLENLSYGMAEDFGAFSNREAARIKTHVSIISSAGQLATES
jgi:hypothetical protein